MKAALTAPRTCSALATSSFLMALDRRSSPCSERVMRGREIHNQLCFHRYLCTTLYRNIAPLIFNTNIKRCLCFGTKWCCLKYDWRSYTKVYNVISMCQRVRVVRHRRCGLDGILRGMTLSALHHAKGRTPSRNATLQHPPKFEHTYILRTYVFRRPNVQRSHLRLQAPNGEWHTRPCSMHRVTTEVYFLQSGKLPCLVRRRGKEMQQQCMDRIQLSANDGSVVRISRRTAFLCAWLHGCRSTRCAPLV